MDEELL